MLRTTRLTNRLRTSYSVLPDEVTSNLPTWPSSTLQMSRMAISTAIFPTIRNSYRRQKRPRHPQLKKHQNLHFSTYVSSHYLPLPGEVEAFLNRHRVKHRCSSTHAMVEECPFCHPTRGLPDNLYALCIDRESGLFLCHRCNKRGNWFDLKKMFSAGMVVPMYSDESKSAPPQYMRSSKQSTQKLSASPAPKTQESLARTLWNDEGSVARSYLNTNRGLKNEVLKKYGVGCGTFDIFAGSDVRPKERCITFPMYDDSGKVMRHKIRPVETKSGMRLLPKGGRWGLFGLDTVPSDATSVVLTEGEFDAMSVYQCTGRPAISVPNGANSLPVELIPYLERFDEIYLWMDEDEPGQTGAETFANKLGVRRCRIVRGLHVDGKPCKDANEGLLRKVDLESLIQRAEVTQHSGLVKFQDIRDLVLADLNNIQDPNVMKSQSIPRLHELMKGFRPGEFTILSGPTGSGKTTLLSQLSLDYCVQGVPTLWGSFEMDNARLAGKMLWQFHAVYSKGSQKDLMDDFDYWADRFAELPCYFMRYHGSNPLEQIIEAMDFAHYMYDCRHVVLDNLQFMSYGQRSGFHQGQFEVMDEAVGQLREFCTKRKVHVTLVVHPRKTEDGDKLQLASVYGSAKATQEADNVLILQTTNEGRRLEVKKNRFDGSVGGIPLKFDKKRLMFSQGDSCGGWFGWETEKKETVGTESDRHVEVSHELETKRESGATGEVSNTSTAKEKSIETAVTAEQESSGVEGSDLGESNQRENNQRENNQREDHGVGYRLARKQVERTKGSSNKRGWEGMGKKVSESMTQS